MNLRLRISFILMFVLCNLGFLSSQDKEDNTKEIAQSWLFDGDRLYYENEIVPSTRSYLKATEIAKSDQNLDSLTTYGYIYAAANYNQLNLFKKSIETLQDGLPFSKNLSDSSYLADYYSNLGGAYFHLGELGSSITYFDSCLMVETILKDTSGMLKAVNNIGKINLLNNQTGKAIEYYQQASSLGTSIGIGDNLKSILLTNLGYAFLKDKDFDNADKIFNESLELSRIT